MKGPMPAPDFGRSHPLEPGDPELRGARYPEPDDVIVMDEDLPVEVAPAAPGPTWITAAAAIDEPSPQAVVEGIAYENSLSVLVGQSGAGKTFMADDLGAAVSTDLDWHGRAVQHGSVCSLSFEGHKALRLRALRDVGGHRLEHFYLIRGGAPLSPIVDRERVERPSPGELEVGDALKGLSGHLAAHRLPPIVLVIVDTVRASLAGSEDNSENVSAYLRAVRRLMGLVPGAGFLLVHHAGWQDGDGPRKRERGSSAFRGNVDVTLFVEAEEYDPLTGTARLTLTTLKARDAELLPPLHLVRRRVDLPGLVDRFGRPVTSCLIAADGRSPEERQADQARAEAEAGRELDKRVLRLIGSRPDLTSKTGIRAAVGVARPDLERAIARLVERGWLQPPMSQRKPYSVTPRGQMELAS